MNLREVHNLQDDSGQDLLGTICRNPAHGQADSEKFNDKYIKDGAKGGHRAAWEFKAIMEGYLQGHTGLNPHWNVVEI
ncbi:hypothetical protein LTR85_011462 [Meristemomyces frigidus]|nr:hypothetical protein LTR85_011462 [Meristemomyces frigidus]